MAGRDRYGGFSEPATTPLQRYIQNACDPQNYEPNLALDLEIADLINSKKGSAPREAAIAIVNHINHRNPNVSLLALTLLDICVKNCGYPFHLQISTKEFLNELVRRFPERPPMRYSRVQNKVLELIEEWRQTICQTSKYKEDLGFIRDMHRLLTYKGYMFPEINKADAAVLNPSDRLQSAEEMEAEEKAAQSAKLQELIRRGTPHDLQEANKLMKVMAGYDNRNKTDYRAKAAEEVSKVQQKARILEEMLQEYKPGDKTNSDTFDELGSALASAQPRIQKMCEEESEDQEAVAKLFEINDSIHRTLERYRLVKKGDLEGAAKIPKGTLGMSGAGVHRGAGNELSLIDFGPEDAVSSSGQATSQTPSVPPKQTRPEDDLLGLSLQDNPPGAISLGTSTNPPFSSASQPAVSQPAPQTQKPQPSSNANFDLFGSISESEPSRAQQRTQPQQTAFTPPIPANKPQQPQQPIATPALHAADPFASISSGQAPREASPFQFQQSIRTPPSTSSPAPAAVSNLVALSSLNQASSTTSSNQTQNNGTSAPSTATGAPDDEWEFASALPDSSHEIVVVSSDIHAVFLVSRPPEEEKAILIKSSISNNSAANIEDLTFQIAVTKAYSLKLEPQSGRSLAPHQRNGITQVIRLYGADKGAGSSVKVRWKANYWLGGQQRSEQGEITSLGIQ